MDYKKRQEPKLSISSVIIFYSILTVGGLIWNSYIDKKERFITPLKGFNNIVLSIATGIFTAFIVIKISNFMEKHIKPMKSLSEKLSSMISNISLKEAAIFAIASAIGEEFLFRGGMLPSLGLVASSLIFGFSHGMFQKPYQAWSIFAMVVGFVLGTLTLYTGTVVAAVICHFTINYFNFLDLIKNE